MLQLSDRITTLNKGGSDGWEASYRARQKVDAALKGATGYDYDIVEGNVFAGSYAHAA